MLSNDKDYVREIITDTSKLCDRCPELNVKDNYDEIAETVVELKETLRQHKTGIGLAAPQIGKNLRMFVINFNGNMRAFINPMFTHTNDLVLSREGCLSLPGKTYLVPRYSNIRIAYQDPQGKNLQTTLVGMAAFVFQHELDHLEGLSLDMIGLEIDEDFDNASQEDKDKIIEMYLESLKRREENLNKEIEADPELKKMRDSVTFMEKVKTGEIKLESRDVTEEEKEKIESKLNETKNEESDAK